MDINHMIENQHISKYRLAKNSGIPYMTINDICSGKTNLADCNARTIYKLSKELGVTMEEMLEPYLLPRPAFELFKSNVCHRLKELGDIDFLIDTIESGDIVKYYQRSWYPESLYLLAMVDYISRENDVPLVENRPLARALFAATQVGDYVPRELYQAVAEVLAYVYRLRRKKQRARA